MWTLYKVFVFSPPIIFDCAAHAAQLQTSIFIDFFVQYDFDIHSKPKAKILQNTLNQYV